MEGEYYDTNPAAMREDMDGSLGVDGPGEGAGVADRGLFGRHHGHGGDGGEYASEVGGGGYGGRPPMPYDGGYGPGGYGGRPPAEGAYEGGYGGPAPPEYGEASDLGHGDRGNHGGRHGHNKKDEDEVGHERKHKHRAEAAAAAALGYGLYERHLKDNAEEKLEGVHGYDSDGRKKPDDQKYDY